MITKIGALFYGKDPFIGFQDQLYAPYPIHELPVLAFKDAVDLAPSEKILFLGSPDAAYSGAEKIRSAGFGEILHLFDKKNDVNEWLLEHSDHFNGGSLHTYERFLRSLRIKKLDLKLTPVPLDFISGAEILYRKKIRFDLIYIDETFHDEAILEKSKILLRLIEPTGVIALSQKHELYETLSQKIVDHPAFDGETANLKTVRLIGSDLHAAFTAKREAKTTAPVVAASVVAPAPVTPPPGFSVTQAILQKNAVKTAPPPPVPTLSPEEEVAALMKNVNLADLPPAAAKLLQNPGVKKNPTMVRNILRNNPPVPKAQIKPPVAPPKPPELKTAPLVKPDAETGIPGKEELMKKLPPLPKVEPGQSALAALLRSPDFKNNPAALREAVRRYSAKKGA